MHSLDLFYEISLIVVCAGLLSILFKFIKQPLVLAHIFTGIVLSAFFLKNTESAEFIDTLSKFGITLLLFLLGLELKFSELRSIGKVALITGIGQIFFTVLIGFVINSFLGFNVVEAFLVAIALTFSSTIIIVKLLSDKKEINSLHGKISVGFLLVQDFCAIIALILITGLSVSGSSINLWEVFFLLSKTVFIFAFVLFLSEHLFPKIVKFISSNHELFYIVSIAWALGFASLLSLPFFGLTIEIGSFLAGLSLANSLESTQIISRVRSLRDFFIMIFFVTLGTTLSFDNILSVLPISIILSLFVLIGNPIIVLVILRRLGYNLKTGFKCGLTVAQISEFSLILAVSGMQKGFINNDTLSILTLVAAFTFTISTYMILHSDSMFRLFEPILKVFDTNHKKNESVNLKDNMKDHIVLIGAHRMGQSMLKFLPKSSLVIIDFDPDRVRELLEEDYNVVLGDVSDVEILELACVRDSHTVISTVPSFEENLILITYLNNLKNKPQIYVIAHENDDKEDLIRHGADHVIMPYSFAGEKLAKSIIKNLQG